MFVVAGERGDGAVTRRVAVEEAPEKIAGRTVHVLVPPGGQNSTAPQMRLAIPRSFGIGLVGDICVAGYI